MLISLRWRIARLIAPAPIIARPLGDGKAFLLFQPDHDSDWLMWVEASTFTLSMETAIPAMGDSLALSNWMPSTKGTFSGTVG